MAPTSKVIFIIAGIVLGMFIIGLTVTTGPPKLVAFQGSPNSSSERLMEARLSDMGEAMRNYEQGQQRMSALSQDILQIKEMLDKRDKNASQEMDIRKLAEDLSTIKELMTEHDAAGDKLKEEMDQSSAGRPVLSKDDNLHHNDDNSTAQQLYRSVRVLCYVPVADNALRDKAVHTQRTWGRHCNKLIFFVDHEPSDKVKEELGLDTVIGLGVADTGSNDLTKKMFAAMDHLYNNYLNEYEWFMKADTDTYVVAENLRYLLSDYKPSQPMYFGHHFKVHMKNGYMSGGGGYAMSREALKRFGEQGYGKLCTGSSGIEDVEIGRCMEKMGVLPGDSRDKLGRSRFHCLTPKNHVHGDYPQWYKQYDKYGAKEGMDSISDYAITFHFLNKEELYMLEFYIYHLRPYGILAGLQHLNRDDLRPATPNRKA